MDLNQLSQKLKQITHEKVKGEFQREIRTELSLDVLDMVRSNWRQGRAGNGMIGSYSTESSYDENQRAGYDLYYPFKHNLNPEPGLGNVDLILTGRYANSLFIPQNDHIIDVDSDDWKRDKLVTQYGGEQFDLSTEQEKEIIDIAKEYVYENLFNWLNG
jgi:hypothetical protein